MGFFLVETQVKFWKKVFSMSVNFTLCHLSWGFQRAQPVKAEETSQISEVKPS